MQTMTNHKRVTSSYIEYININKDSDGNVNVINLTKNNFNEANLLDKIPYDKFMYLVDYSYNALIKTVSVMEPEIGRSEAQKIESQLDEYQEIVFIQLREVYERIILECCNRNQGA